LVDGGFRPQPVTDPTKAIASKRPFARYGIVGAMETLDADRAAVEAQIRAAFAGVRLGKGVSLRQARAIDRYGDGMTDEETVTGAEITDSWSDVSFIELERDCIAHLDNDGLRYYLPALMLSLLSNYDPGSMRVIGTISALYPKGPGFPTRSYTFLTDDQHRAVASFLSALPQLVTLDTEDSKCVARALRNYWGQFATPMLNSGQ
jgi:hypothetical protein